MENNDTLLARDAIFALDIGTRSIIGIVCIKEDEKLKILASEMCEHDKRTMYDGQIHDIEGVSKVVSKVKSSLESKLGFKLKRVAIAAAGRALKTSRGSAQMKVDFTTEIDKSSVESLELEAIQSAQSALGQAGEGFGPKYYCVGHSVTSYHLDGNYIESLIGHRGDQISVEVLATFLPNIVVDSLYSVMDRVGLEVESLTLEPIAAINVAIKKNMRLLNLAMVDIGAGTCDIAITNSGTISAYAMVPGAGDKITEAISQSYLLDFDTAENVKRQLFRCDEITFSDIVGIDHTLNCDEILACIEPAIRDMGVQIAQEILKYNTKSPGAVFLVGGASQIPLLPQVIAQELEIPAQRVAVRDSSIASEFEGITDNLKGPDSITPLGIALEHSQNLKKNFLEITFNEKTIRMFNSKALTVSDALVISGFNPRNLIPQNGDSLEYTFNGVKKSIKGLPGIPASITLNGSSASLADFLSDGDALKVVSAQKGPERKLSLHECLAAEGCGDNLTESSVSVNGQSVDLDYEISCGDSILVECEKVIIEDDSSVEPCSNVPAEEFNSEHGYTASSDNGYEYGLFDNDYEDDFDDMDFYSTDLSSQASPRLSTKAVAVEAGLEHAKKHISEQAGIEKFLYVSVNGEKVNISHSKDKLILTDIFEYIDFDISKPKGFLTLSVNGEKKGFNYELKNGDSVDISWE